MTFRTNRGELRARWYREGFYGDLTIGDHLRDGAELPRTPGGKVCKVDLRQRLNGASTVRRPTTAAARRGG